MKNYSAILLSLILFFATTNCKKTRLKDEFAGLGGSWTWISGWSDRADKEFRLELIEKGSYQLFKGNEKIDFGRLVSRKGRLTFVSEKPLKKGFYYATMKEGQHKIIHFNSDTLIIGSDEWFDFPTSTYVKNK